MNEKQSKHRLAIYAGIVSTIIISEGISAYAATPSAYLENATIVGAGNTLRLTRVPIVVGANILYDDVAINFQVGSTGALSVALGSPVVSASASLITASFVAGTYTFLGQVSVDAAVVSGPGVVNGGGTQWSLSSANSDSQGLGSATWYVGSISSNPL